MQPYHHSFVLSRAEVRELDQRAIEQYGMSGLVLMENAGRGAAEVLMRLNPERLPVVILCGPGNNGGDGLVMARHLDYDGYDVDVMLFAPSAPIREGGFPPISDDAAANFNIWRRYRPIGGVTFPIDDSSRYWSESITNCWIVDALFGTGLSRPLDEDFAEIVGVVNASGNHVLAVDIPSGLDCDTGQPLGAAIRATHTVTFVAPKKGFREPSAQSWLGQVHVVDIGAPKDLVDEYRRKSQ